MYLFERCVPHDPSKPPQFRLESPCLIVEISSVGAAMLSMQMKREGQAPLEILRGPSLAERLTNPPYHGAAIGRVANRIGGAAFEGHVLEANEGKNHLHGGSEGFHAQVWDAHIEADSLCLRLQSPDGHMGYPGKLDVSLRYTFTDAATLRLDFEGCCDQDSLFNPTNHNFYNLDPDAKTIHGHDLQVKSKGYTPSGPDLLPTGEVQSFPHPIDDACLIDSLLVPGPGLLPGGGLDHNFLIDQAQEGPVAVLSHPRSQLRLLVHSDLPALQIYSCQDPYPGQDFAGRPMEAFYALCLEPQFCPDAIHHPQFEAPRIAAGSCQAYAMSFTLQDLRKEPAQ